MVRFRKPTLCDLCLEPAAPDSRFCKQHQDYAAASVPSDVEPLASADQPIAAPEHHVVRHRLIGGLLVLLVVVSVLAAVAVWWVAAAA
jgi:hypothetical protein